MKLLWSICFLLMLGPRLSAAEELKNLHQVQIVIEDLNELQSHAIGLSKTDLESQTLVALKRDIPKLQVNATANAIFYVNIIAAEGKTASPYVGVCLSIEVSRRVKVLGDDGQTEVGKGFATVWDTAYLLGGGREDMATRVREKLSELITQFAAAYYRQNPN